VAEENKMQENIYTDDGFLFTTLASSSSGDGQYRRFCSLVKINHRRIHTPDPLISQ
jgi:hypothetical protein